MLSMETFLVILQYLTDLKGWPEMQPVSKSRLYQQISGLIDDTDFEQLMERTVAQAEGYIKPDAILTAVKEHRRHLANQKALPAGPEANFLTDEAIAFRRLAPWLAKKGWRECTVGGCDKTTCHCVRELMAQPVTEEERAAAANTNPVDRVLSGH